MFYRLNPDETKYKKHKIGNITIFTGNVCVLIFGHRVLLRFSCLLEGFLKLSIKTLIGIILYFQSGVLSILLQGFKKIFVSDWGFNVKLTGNTTATLLLKSSREIWRARVFPNVPCVFTRYFVRQVGIPTQVFPEPFAGRVYVPSCMYKSYSY